MVKTFYVPIFTRRTVFTDSKDGWRSAAKRAVKIAKGGGEDPDLEQLKDSDGLTGLVGRTVIMGVFNNDLETVVHEADHAATNILSYAGVELSAENDEPHAYLTGWLVREWYRRMGKKPKFT